MRKLEIGTATLNEMGADMLTAWQAADAGKPVTPKEALYFDNMPQLLSTLTPTRWLLLEALRSHGAMSIYALAKQVKRNYSNVHSDIGKLFALGLVEKDNKGLVFVPWDEIRADFALKAAA